MKISLGSIRYNRFSESEIDQAMSKSGTPPLFFIGPMEVFHMDKYKMHEDMKASEAYQKRYNAYDRRHKSWRSGRRQWDYIICKTCIGCGKPLSRYENLRGLAFCFSCREILFPETIPPYKYRDRRYLYPAPRGHFL